MSTTPSSVAPTAPRTFQVPQLIAAMLKSGEHVSDLIFSPGRAPQIEVSGQLVERRDIGDCQRFVVAMNLIDHGMRQALRIHARG